MINKKLFNNNYNDKKQFADNEVILNWLAFQKQENEEKINSSNTQIENKYYKISTDCINVCNNLIKDHQDLQKVYEEISKKIGILEKKYRNTKVRLEKEIIYLNIENWKTIKKKIKLELDKFS
jgi:archaellum component FlaC